MTTAIKETDRATEAPASVASSDWFGVVADEIKLLKKEMALIQLRIEEARDPDVKETLRKFGSCLWRHEQALSRIQVPNK